MNERQLDTTWPSPRPTREQVRGVFFDTLGSASRWQPEAHLSRVREILYNGEIYDHLTRTLHKLLSVQHETNDARLSGKNVIVSSADTTLLNKHMGMHRFDLRKQVFPILRNSFAEAMTSHDESQEKLDTLALTIGTVTAEAQAFSDGNTRIARTLHDYIKGGEEALTIERIADVTRNFSASHTIEKLIAMQNMTQLIEHPEVAALNTDGVMMVSEKAEQRYAQAEVFMKDIWRLNDFRWQDMDDQSRYEARMEVQDRVKAIIPRIADHDLMIQSYGTLLQQYYAPAALATSFAGRFPSLPLSPQAMEWLVDTNDTLMKMRTLSLGIGMARKGLFASIEKSPVTGRPAIMHRYWRPTIS